jgi:hypothetical protein
MGNSPDATISATGFRVQILARSIRASRPRQAFRELMVLMVLLADVSGALAWQGAFSDSPGVKPPLHHYLSIVKHFF